MAGLEDPPGDAGPARAQVAVGRAVASRPAVRAVAPIGASPDHRTLAFQVVPKQGPNSVSTVELVRDLRTLTPLSGEADLGVAGNASGNIDVSQKLSDALPLYLGLVVGLSLLIMVLVFRSVVVPLIATAGFVRRRGRRLAGAEPSSRGALRAA